MRNHCCDKRKSSRGSRGTQDQKLIDIVHAHGDQGNWESIPRAAGLLRCGKSHRLPWLNYLHPDVKQAPFEEDEADLIIKLHRLLGDRWSLIAGRLPGRTDNEIKNYWNSHLKKKIASLGTNPHNYWNSHLKKKLAGLGTNPHSHQVNQTRLDRKVGDHDKMRHEQSDGEVSDATSLCMDDHMKDKSASEQQLPDLNLDLTLSLPCDRDPTLLLLR